MTPAPKDAPVEPVSARQWLRRHITYLTAPSQELVDALEAFAASHQRAAPSDAAVENALSALRSLYEYRAENYTKGELVTFRNAIQVIEAFAAGRQAAPQTEPGMGNSDIPSIPQVGLV